MNFKKYLAMNYEQKLDAFMALLSTTNRTPEYYINWEKVDRETKKYELELNTLNYLIGKKDIEKEAKKLFTSQPNLLKAIPTLIASRDKIMDVLIIDDEDKMDFFTLDFQIIDESRLDIYLEFIENAGLLDFFKNKARQNLVDFVYGVESGLDSNARKNRSGAVMEGILDRKIISTCKKLNYQYKSQATSRWMQVNWGVNVPVDKSQRRFDEAIYDPFNNKVYVIETNYYGGGGSKLKAVAGEFKTLNQLINLAEDDVTFIWVTDGLGWKTARLPLEEAFKEISYVFNLEMLSEDFLFQLIK